MAADYPKHRHLYAIFFVSGVAAMLFFSVFLHINSIFVSSVVFVLCTVVMFTLRRDLIRPAIYSAVMILPILICIYIVLFDIVAPRFWDTYWLLAGTAWDVRFFGNVPLTEMIWYISWVMLASTSYPFVAGKAIVRSSSR
jgi:hypothetical protein